MITSISNLYLSLLYTSSKNGLIKTLTAKRVFKEISVRPRVPQYQVFSARYSHRYFSNASRTNGGLKNDLSFRLFATLKPLAVVEYNEGKCGIGFPAKWFLMPPQLGKKSNGTKNLAFSSFWEFLLTLWQFTKLHQGRV